MNNNYYQNPTFPEATNNEQIYEKDKTITDIINNNKNKNMKIYASYPNSNTWQTKIFEGTLNQIINNHFILNGANNIKYIINFNNIDYIEIIE